MIDTIRKELQYFRMAAHDFGVSMAIKHCVYRRRFYRYGRGMDELKDEVYNYLYYFLKEQIKEYQSIKEVASDDAIYKKIWVCWWNGPETMPELVKLCFDNLKRNAPDDYTVTLINKFNYSNYVDIPDYIIETLNTGGLSITNLSDILREALLYYQGGQWIDASVWVTPDFTRFIDYSKDFWSINLGTVKKKYMLGQVVSGCKWSGFYLYGKKGNLVCKFAFEAMCRYFKNHTCTIDYFIQNFIIRIAYDHVPVIQEMIDSIEISNTDLYSLYLVLNEKYDAKEWERMTKNTGAFKLTQKRQYDVVYEGRMTYWGYIKNVLSKQ